MEIKITPMLAGFNKSFSVADVGFDLGQGHIRVRARNVAGYCTHIPISDASYRKRNPTKARATYELKNGWHTFTLWDDWGDPNVIEISDDAEGRALAMKQIENLRANALMGAA